jgi:hypothetical protein
VGVPLGTDPLELTGPHCDSDLTQMCGEEEVHVRPHLTDASPDRERDLVVKDCLVVREIQEVQLTGDLELLLRGLRDSIVVVGRAHLVRIPVFSTMSGTCTSCRFRSFAIPSSMYRLISESAFILSMEGRMGP